MRPSRKELAVKLQELETQSAVARFYGVSESTVARWIRVYELPVSNRQSL